jgi:small subunit ribosomal protein S6
MRAYELAVILDGELEDHVARGWSKTIAENVAAHGGRIVGDPDWWGKRRFAFEIRKKTEGYYVFYNVVAPGAALDEVERTLRLADDVVRHKLIRLPDREAARRGMVATDAA